MNKSPILLVTVALLAISQAGISSAASPGSSPHPNQLQSSPRQDIAWLGVGVEAIPESVTAHLLANVPAGQGIMITHVDPGSPADLGGLAAYDILLGFEDQKLYSPRQLTELVRAREIGSEVQLSYVHQGEVAQTRVLLGQHPGTRPQSGRLQRNPGPMPGFPTIPGFPGFPGWGSGFPGFSNQPMPHGLAPRLGEGPRGQGGMESFNALTISQINGRYSVEVTYLDQEGVEQSASYKGNREQIQQVIEEDPNLPEDQRQQLLKALEMQHAPAVPDIRSLMQGFRHPMFQSPMFQSPMFRDPAFQNPFFQQPWSYPGQRPPQAPPRSGP